jgi:NitT/TauT family transport system ATP-binding protein
MPFAGFEMKVVVYGVTKEYVSAQGSVRALGGVSFEVRDREFFGIIGPTGCGKTTLLHIIAGLEKQSTGTVEFIGERHSKSIVSMVFQDAALMPWRTVEENVPLGAEFRREDASVYKKLSRFFLEVVKLLDFASARPHELSGGMKQKAAIARALANDPEVILMDEPFANLDAQTRLLMRDELLRIWERDKKTVILVTHNLEEAVMLCDRIAVMSSRPALIKEVINVDIPRPRTMKSMREPEFAKCMEKIWNLLRYEVDEAMRVNPPS